jgi:uncharacterized repeat protein (TIGR03803 family)
MANLGAGNSGEFANGRLVQAADGNFYGTTQQGGARSGGTVFRLDPSSGQLTAIYAFVSQPSAIGNASFAALVVGADGNLYGSTTGWGSGNGSTFKMTLGAEATVLGFNDLASAPYSYTQFLLMDDGSFYTASYKLNGQPSPPLPPITSTILHFAPDGTGLSGALMDPIQGDDPKAPLIAGGDGNLYGTASKGGVNDLGTVFRVSAADVITLLHPFNGADGSTPESPLVKGSDGDFYGTTTLGGLNDMGTVFRMTPAGAITTLKSFSGADGKFPAGGITMGPNGFLYGTTNAGGDNDSGTFYRISLAGAFTPLASFGATTGTTPANGITLGSDGNFYGTTLSGGDYLNGTAYRVTLNGVVTKLASLGDPEGVQPRHGVIEGRDGNFYGSTGFRGFLPRGTIFKMDPKGKTTTLAFLNNPTAGTFPTPIVQGNDGNLYGAAVTERSGQGSVFKVNLSGGLTVLASLNNTTGYAPADFLLGLDGNFYGLAARGGTAAGGTIFQVTPAGVVSPFASLSVNANGVTYFRFTQNADGNFYGTASETGSEGGGVAFEVSASGAQRILASFAVPNVAGYKPSSGLTRGPDGNFYGETLSGGGPLGNGTVFELTPAGTLSAFHVFSETEANGAAGRLLRMPDGSLFGTTIQNENNGSAGLIFRITTDGEFQKWPVFDELHGSQPEGALTLASDGYIYGTTVRGGTVGGGVVFRFAGSAPRVNQVTPTGAHAGETVIIAGSFLEGVTIVTFNGIPASFTIDSGSQITATIPEGATTGPVELTSPFGAIKTSSFILPLPLLNISTRMQALTGDNVAIGGFIVGGTEPKKVLLRGIGPSLARFNIQGTLADPTLDLFQGSNLLATNDNWKDTQESEIEATENQPTNDAESAIIRTLSPGSYTAILRGKNNTSGVGLAEVYDLDDTAASDFANISTRGFVGAGDNVMIGGFVSGNAGAKVLVRAVGPSLTPLGVANAIADPTLSLFDDNGTQFASNDNWKEAQQVEIEATGLAPLNEAESAILITRPQGNTTAIVRGKNNATGVGLVEVYIIP